MEGEEGSWRDAVRKGTVRKVAASRDETIKGESESTRKRERKREGRRRKDWRLSL